MTLFVGKGLDRAHPHSTFCLLFSDISFPFLFGGSTNPQNMLIVQNACFYQGGRLELRSRLEVDGLFKNQTLILSPDGSVFLVCSSVALQITD